MIGTTLGHYRVLALLGRGAMSEVYLAFDEQLRRKVALKVLASADDPDRRRHLQREARALAALNHAGIVSVHGVEQQGDLLLLATEYVDGTPLGALIPQDGMPFDELAKVGASLAEAVGAAHRQGIIHRDLKPSNVMVTAEGGVKVLDFGLAKIHTVASRDTVYQPDGTSTGTVAGTIAGTAHYMSPEQAQGLPVDARSDIFSLGIVLFHMATGHRPFEGATHLAVLSSIIKDTPPPVTDLRPDLPPAFARLVARCLEKDPGRRVQDAVDLAAQLQDLATETASVRAGDSGWLNWTQQAPRAWWTAAALTVLMFVGIAAWGLSRLRTAPVALDTRLVAVAPFDNRTNDSSLDAIGLMVTDRVGQGLIDQLSLRVVAGPVVIEYWPAAPRNGAADADRNRVTTLAKRVGAGVVVSGDYYTLDGTLSFRVRITDTENGREIIQFGPVTGPLQRPAEAVEKVRDYVVGEAAVHFKGGGGAALAGLPRDFAPTGPPMPYEAYRELLAGLNAFGRDPRVSTAHLERVEQLYPHRALVLPWLTLSYMRLGEFDRARRYVESVGERIAPEDASLVRYFRARLDGQWLDAYDSIRAFHRTAPQHLPTVNTTAGAALALGRPREALSLLSSIDLAPWKDSPSGQTALSMQADAEHMLGRYEEERRVAIALAESAPESATALVRSLAALGRADEIASVIERSQVAGRRAPSPIHLLKQAAEELRAHGHADDSRSLAEAGRRRLNALDSDAARSPTNRQVDGELLLLLDRWREASEVFGQLAAERPDDPALLAGLGVARARLHDPNGAVRAMRQLEQLSLPNQFGADVLARARVAAALNQEDAAVALLQQAFSEGQVIIWRAHTDLALGSLRGHAAFERITAMNQEVVAAAGPQGQAGH